MTTGTRPTSSTTSSSSLDALVKLLTDDEVRALFARVQEELLVRQGHAGHLVDTLTEQEARLLRDFRAIPERSQEEIGAHAYTMAREA